MSFLPLLHSSSFVALQSFHTRFLDGNHSVIRAFVRPSIAFHLVASFHVLSFPTLPLIHDLAVPSRRHPIHWLILQCIQLFISFHSFVHSLKTVRHWLHPSLHLQPYPWSELHAANDNIPIGPIAVPCWGSYIEPYKVIPKRNYYGASGYADDKDNWCVYNCPCLQMGVSENRDPLFSTLNSRILIIRTHK